MNKEEKRNLAKAGSAILFDTAFSGCVIRIDDRNPEWVLYQEFYMEKYGPIYDKLVVYYTAEEIAKYRLGLVEEVRQVYGEVSPGFFHGGHLYLLDDFVIIK